jgi:hypothetical protein
MFNLKIACAGLLCIAAFSTNAEAKLFKWVDKDGVTHYGETIPPEYADRDSVELNSKGQIQKRREGFSAESRHAIKEAEAKKSADDEAGKEAKRRESALLNTYTNEQEIDLARDRSLQQVDARIYSYTTLLKSAQETLDGHYKEQDNITKLGRNIPQSLTEDIEQALARVGKYKKEVALSEQEKINVQSRFDSDKARFRQLKGVGK